MQKGYACLVINIWIVLSVAPKAAWGQNFVPLSIPGDPGIRFGSVDWVDYDQDNDLDIFVSGFTNGSQNAATLYRNDAGTFVLASQPTLTGVSLSDSDWGDYDQDGDLDLILIGNISGSASTTIYENSNGFLSPLNAGIIGMRDGSVDWGDYDQDGDLDILLTGSDQNNMFSSFIYRNDGGNFVDINAGLVGVFEGDGDWVDYDQDGDLDAFICGNFGSGGFSSLYANNGGNFTALSGANFTFPASDLGSVDWGDYDNDGDLDLLLTGLNDIGEFFSNIYENDLDSNLFRELSTSLDPIVQGDASWGDFDSDGDLDILLSGTGNGSKVSAVYENAGGSFIFVESLSSTYNLVDLAWGDYDQDNDLDILIGGTAGMTSRPQVEIYRNNSTQKNTPPSPPGNLSAVLNSATQVSLRWAAPSTDETPANGLSYNLRIGTSPGSQDILSPPSDPSTGFLRIAEIGVSHFPSYTINNLAPGTYYWSVQSVDHNFAGSAFAAEQSFRVCSPPASPASAVQIGDISCNLAQISNWEAPSGGAEGYLVVFSDNPNFGNPSGFTNTSPDTVYGGMGEQLVYRGSSIRPITVTGLQQGLTYYVRVFAQNCDILFNTDVSSSNPVSFQPLTVTELSPPENLIANPESAVSIRLDWEDENTAEEGFQIFRALGRGGSFSLIGQTGPNVFTFLDNSLDGTQEYFYRVRAFGCGLVSDSSNRIGAQPAATPAAPQNLQCQVQDGGILLTWTDASDNEDAFRLELRSFISENSFLEVGQFPPNTTSFLVSDLQSNLTFAFRIRAINDFGNSAYSNICEVMVPPDTNIAAPEEEDIEDLSASSISESEINLSWEYPPDEETIFLVQRTTQANADFSDSLQVSFLGFVLNNKQFVTKRFIDTQGIIADTVYFYRIIAINAGGTSLPSDIASARAECRLSDVLVVVRNDGGNADEIICDGKSASMTVLPSNISNAQYQWRFRDRLDSNPEPIPEATFRNFLADRTGYYDCLVSIGGSSTCQGDSRNQLFVIILEEVDPPLVNIAYDGSTFQASNQTADAYQWYFNYEPIVGATQPTFRPEEEGVYYLIVTFGESDASCTSTSNLLTFPNNPTSLQNALLSEQIEVSPNPSRDRFQVSLRSELRGAYQINLLDTQGRRFRISEGRKNDFNLEEDIAWGDFPRGAYLLEVQIEGVFGYQRLIRY